VRPDHKTRNKPALLAKSREAPPELSLHRRIQSKNHVLKLPSSLNQKLKII